MKRVPAWLKKAHEEIVAMDNETLFEYLLEATAGAADDEDQSGNQAGWSVCADIAKDIMQHRLIVAGFLKEPDA